MKSRKKSKKVDPTHKLWGEEYLSDDEWQLMEIMRGSLSECKAVKDASVGQYRDMNIFKIK